VSSKIKTLGALKEIVAEAKAGGQKVVFTNGCFDLLHPGHLHLLREAKKMGDCLVVGLNSDLSVKMIKGPNRPIWPERERAEMLAALETVDYVISFDEADPRKLIEALGPDVLVKGGDWTEEQVVGREIVEQRGGKVAVVPYLQGHSTTKIIEAIRGK
jgi:D-beta-D-heptose 7-phosphate kinase/D-beta-D-heptose 1-phosphate adenosyltransferase